jgi:glycine cleavage system H protein
MGNVPNNLRYTEEHEWVKVDGEKIVIGITDFAQDALTEVVWVEWEKDVGEMVDAMEPFASVESVKSVSQIYSPVAGEVVELNEALIDNPSSINEAPYGEGWIAKIEVNNNADLEGLLGSEDYAEIIGG